MIWSQSVVVSWIEFVLAAALMLFLARRMLTRFPQPVDRIRLIQSALAAAMAMPVLLTLAPWPAWRWQVIEPVETQAVRVEHFIVPESTDLAPQDSLSGTPMMNLGPKPMVPLFVKHAAINALVASLADEPKTTRT